MRTFSQQTIERFWARVDRRGGPGACWPWTGYLTWNGYGRVRADGGRYGSHRLAYLLSSGTVPDGMSVCHRCDNPSCCNPAHMWLGTQSENMADMTAKGRRAIMEGDQNGSRRHPDRRAYGDRNGTRKFPERLARGASRPGAKLTDEKVRAILAECGSGRLSQVEAARRFGVSRSLVGLVVRRRAWTHVESPAFDDEGGAA